MWEEGEGATGHRVCVCVCVCMCMFTSTSTHPPHTHTHTLWMKQCDISHTSIREIRMESFPWYHTWRCSNSLLPPCPPPSQAHPCNLGKDSKYWLPERRTILPGSKSHHMASLYWCMAKTITILQSNYPLIKVNIIIYLKKDGHSKWFLPVLGWWVVFLNSTIWKSVIFKG